MTNLETLQHEAQRRLLFAKHSSGSPSDIMQRISRATAAVLCEHEVVRQQNSVQCLKCGIWVNLG